MTRVRMRASRALVVFLAVSLIIVIVIARGRKSAPPMPSGRILTATPALLMATSVTAAATTQPTTQPATQPIAVAPTTRPIVQVVVTPPLLEARTKLAKDPLSTRRILNEELLAGHLSGAELDEARELLARANEQLVFSGRAFEGDAYSDTYTIRGGDNLTKIASGYDLTWEFLARINNITDARKIRARDTLKVIKGPFHAVVSKHNFTMDIYLGVPGSSNWTFVTSYRVGLGKDDSTPTGSWMAAGKLKNPAYYSPRGEGIIAADDPANPLGERWIGLVGFNGSAVGKNSYGIHGTIDPNSIGREESMGCIRMRNEDVEVVYELLVEGKSTVMVRE